MRHSLAAAAVFLLAGCAANPMSADAAFGGSPTPSAIASDADTHDGIYVGSADVAVNENASCRSPMRITNFRVEGNRIRFGGFRATIGPDGSIQGTAYRGMWMYGRFEGPNFVGKIDATGDTTGLLENCVFAITTTRQTG